MTSPRDQSSSVGDILNRNVGLIVNLVVVVGQVVAVVWMIANANARISRNTDDIAIMQARNIPDRVHSVEDGQTAMQHDIAALQAEYREISLGLTDQSQRLATIQAQLAFVIGQLFPPAGTAKHAP